MINGAIYFNRKIFNIIKELKLDLAEIERIEVKTNIDLFPAITNYLIANNWVKKKDNLFKYKFASNYLYIKKNDNTYIIDLWRTAAFGMIIPYNSNLFRFFDKQKFKDFIQSFTIMISQIDKNILIVATTGKIKSITRIQTLFFAFIIAMAISVLFYIIAFLLY
jgi:hypothetical protein